MKTITGNLCPGSLRASNGSLFDTPASDWKLINDQMAALATIDPKTVSEQPAFANLKRAAERWKPATLPGIIRLAQGIDDYGSNTVGGHLTQLHAFFTDLQDLGPEYACQMHAIVQLFATQMLEPVRQNLAASAGILQDLADLDAGLLVGEKAWAEALSKIPSTPPTPDIPEDPWGFGQMGLAFVQLINEAFESFVQVGRNMASDLTRVRQDIERIRGAWGAIDDQLEAFQSSLNDAISEGEPFVVDLDIDVAVSEWRNLAAEARQFVQSAAGF